MVGTGVALPVELVPERLMRAAGRLGSSLRRLDPIGVLDALGSLPRLLVGVEAVVAGVDALLLSVAGTVARVDALVAGAQDTVERIEPIVDDAHAMVGRVGPVLAVVDLVAADVTGLVATSDVVRARISAIVDDLAPLLATVATLDPMLLHTLDRALTGLPEVLARIDGEVVPAVASLEGLVPTIQALAAQVEDLQHVVGDMGQTLGGIPGAARLRKRATPAH